MTDVTPQETSRLRRVRAAVDRAGRTLYRYGRRIAVTIGVVIAVLVVSTLTIDLGPALKARAERAGGNWLERKMTIGRLGVHLGSGKFVVENLRIDGMYPNEPPWLEAKRIDVSLTWKRAVASRSPARQHRDDRLEDGGRVISRRPSDVPARDRPPRAAAQRARRRRHDAAIRACLPR
jgi:hypothetical protein